MRIINNNISNSLNIKRRFPISSYNIKGLNSFRFKNNSVFKNYNISGETSFYISIALSSSIETPPNKTSTTLDLLNSYNSKFFGTLLSYLIFVLLLVNSNVWLELFGSLKVDEYVSNGTIIEAQRKSKMDKINGDTPKSSMDKFMSSAPPIEPLTGLRLKTPGGNYANYYETEKAEPFLLDNAGNLWIWEGIHPENPKCDWIVRNPEGEIYNFSMKANGKLQQNFVGNEKDLKRINNTNLGDIIGFIGDEINDFHYREIPPHALKSKLVTNLGKNMYLPPPLLEEGFMDLSKKNTIKTLPILETDNVAKHHDIESSIFNENTKFQMTSNPFLKTTFTEETEAIDRLQLEGRISSAAARNLKLDLYDEIEEEALTTAGGIDVNKLNSAF